MLLKSLIVLLFIAVVASLSGAFYTMVQDQGIESRRTVLLLTIRVTLAALLMACVGWGLWTGSLGLGAPWHQ